MSGPAVDRAPAIAQPRFRVGDDWMIPHEPGQAVGRGWPEATGGRPHGVTWHWTHTWTLLRCNELLGGADALRRGQASAHYGIGRSFDEGVERYVSLEDRSWHAGKHQILRFDGRPMVTEDWKGARTTIGIETVSIGFAPPGVRPGRDWLRADGPLGRPRMRIQPWTEEQLEMMIAIGREIVERWPHIRPRDHHGHQDLCPGYKVDVSGFPYARVLRAIYRDPSIPDVWSPYWTLGGRRAGLAALGYEPPTARDADRREQAPWSDSDDQALRAFQSDQGLHVDGIWTTALSWRVHEARGLA